jgi:hypothetical protein
MDWNNLFPSFLGAVTGGILSLIGSVLAVSMTAKHNKRASDGHSQAVVNGYLRSIYTEIYSLYKGYMSSIGELLENHPESQPFLVKYIVEESYFTVYNANASVLVHVNSSEARTAIINTYNISKQLLDTFRVNNSMIRDLEQYSMKGYDTKDKFYIGISTTLTEVLTKMATTLKQIHFRAKNQADELLRLLQEHSEQGERSKGAA